VEISAASTANSLAKAGRVKEHFGPESRYLTYSYNIRLRAEIVKSLMGTVVGCEVLDIGCGDGSISRQFLNSARTVTFVDFSTAMLTAVRDAIPIHLRDKAMIMEGDFMNIEFGARKYDVILCLGVLAHVDSVEATIARLAGLLKPGGRCIFQITDMSRLTSRVFHLYALAVHALYPKMLYKMNVTTSHQVTTYAQSVGMTFKSLARYSFLLPAMRRLPAKWLYEYQRYVAHSRFLSALCTDVIALYELSSENEK
jgi:2-polyprenyl-3-methyl-5-hydroxy-6-metoxy-1,4-benzoquinol methylase